VEAFQGRVAMVTGGASGIGQAAAHAFAARGAIVVVLDLDIDQGEATCGAIREGGGSAHFQHCDITREEDVAAAVAFCVDELGRLDMAFNNAGTPGKPGLLEHCDLRDFEAVLRVNVLGTFLCMKHELQHMASVGSGSIVNTSSLAGLGGAPHMPSYVASKHAVTGLTRAAALDYAHRGVRVNAICPGVVDTPMLDAWTRDNPNSRRLLDHAGPMSRPAQPEEIVALAVWLCSDEASFVTGTAVPIDGGTSASVGL